MLPVQKYVSSICLYQRTEVATSTMHALTNSNFIVDELQEMEGRLDSTITFTLVRFLYNLAASYLQMLDITIFCLVVAIVGVNLYAFDRRVYGYRRADQATLKHKSANRSANQSITALHVMIEMVLRFNFLILSQNISDIAAKYASSTIEMHASIICGRLTAGFGLLLLVSASPPQLTSMAVVQRSISMILYILTDSTSGILQSVDVGVSPGLVGILSMVLLKQIALENDPTVVYVMKGVNMMIVNVFILSIVNNAYTVQERVALLTLTVFAIDTLQGSDKLLEDSRNYAVWKTAQQLHIIYSVYKTDSTILISLSVLIVYIQSQLVASHTHINSTLVELMLLMSVNEVLGNISNIMQSMNGPESTSLLMMYIIIIYTIKRVVFKTSE